MDCICFIRFYAPREAAPKVREATEKALEFGDNPAEVPYLTNTNKTWPEWDFKAAESAFKRSIELNPNFPVVRVSYSHFLMFMHRADEAVVQMERALELDPFSPLFQSLNGALLMSRRRYEDALEQFRKVLKTVPDHGVALDLIGSVFFTWVDMRKAWKKSRSITEPGDFKPH